MNFRLFGGRQLPLLLQTESAECGLACLGMAAGYWGHRFDLPALRRRFASSPKGVTLKTLMSMADALALTPRALRLGLEQLRELRTPCILHWDMNHFVVLQSVRRGYLRIHDPAVGRRRLSLREVSRHFTGVALELAPDNAFQRVDETQHYPLRALMGGVTGLKRALAELLLLGVVLQLCLLLMPFYLQWVVDEALVSADHELLTILAIGALLLVLLQLAVSTTRSWAVTALSASLNFQWLGNVHAHLLRLPLAWFERRHLGDVVSRFGSVQSLQRTFTTQSVEALIDGLLVVVTGIVMWRYAPLLAAIASGAVALYALLRRVLLAGLRRANTEQILRAAQQQTQFMESVRGIQTVRLYGHAPLRHGSWLNLLAEQCNAELGVARLMLAGQSANQLLFGIERVLVIWLGALAALRAELTVGMLFAFLSYQDQFSQRLAALVDKLCEFSLLRLHGERLADIVFTPMEAAAAAVATTSAAPVGAAGAPPAAATCDATCAELRLRQVSFRHADAEPWILQSLDLTIPAGQFVAITGPSGCGKTTLVKLLLGFYAPTIGEIDYAGQRLTGASLARYREQLGAVLQDDLLFAGSIAENISGFDNEPDPQRIVRSAEMAALHAELMAMPMSYTTQVGEAGTGLSGGQKQRVLLARALYRQPRLLVLDEATSHLDVASERKVNAAIRQIPLTRIVIAHRAETIALADRVIELREGRIVSDWQRNAAGREAVRSDPVNEHEQAEPHYVDEVPVPGHRFEREMALRSEMTA